LWKIIINFKRNIDIIGAITYLKRGNVTSGFKSMKRKKTVVIGITGGAGTGKSQFSSFLRELGVVVIDVDSFAKKVMNESTSIKNSLRDSFGPNIFDESGKINSKILSEIVFKKPENLKKLNKIVWPELIEKLKLEIEEFRNRNIDILAVDMAVLFEAKAAHLFDFIVVVDSSMETRLHRLSKNRGLAEERIFAIIDGQIDQSEKNKIADYKIDNEGSLDDLKSKAFKLYEELIRNVR